MSMPSNYHILDFFVDDEGSAALTVHKSDDNTRIHVIADKDDLPAKSAPGKTFKSLTKKYVDNSESSESSSGKDSGIDVQAQEDAEEDIQSFIISPIVDRDENEDAEKPDDITLRQWFDATTTFCSLTVTGDDKLSYEELVAEPDLTSRIDKLHKSISLPKYILDLDLPWYKSEDLTLVATSSSPPPYHPTQVRVNSTGETLFFKLSESEAPKVTKRELHLLNRISKPDLANRVRAPKLVGLVSYADSTTSCIGFLQSEIRGATPLTHKLDSRIDKSLRDRWAKEAQDMKNALHEHGIVWGDAKADNFLVDEHDVLWMIDFGGSYTEGWIDPEIKETEKGDDMGVEKVVHGLKEPECCAMQEDAKNKARDERVVKREERKRKRDGEEEEVDEGVKEAKRRSMEDVKGENKQEDAEEKGEDEGGNNEEKAKKQNEKRHQQRSDETPKKTASDLFVTK